MKNMTRKLAALVLLGGIFAAVLTGCGEKQVSQEGSSSSASAQPVQDSIEMLTADVFSDYDLTLVNVFATWCGPCVAEIPELEKLSQNMAERNMNVIGVCLDTLNSKGEISPDGVAKALELVQRTGATYPIYAPDLEAFGGHFMQVTAVPETFFVDGEGNVVGQVYMGARDLEAWTEIVEAELAALEAA